MSEMTTIQWTWMFQIHVNRVAIVPLSPVLSMRYCTEEIYLPLMDYTHLGSLGGASCHWWPPGGSGCSRLGYRALFIGWGCGGGRTFGWGGLTIGGEGGWAGFGWVWFSWTHVRLVMMELKEATIKVKKKQNRREGNKEKGWRIEKEKAITDCGDSVIWQHSQKPYDNLKKNSKIKLAIYSHFRELMSSNKQHKISLKSDEMSSSPNVARYGNQVSDIGHIHTQTLTIGK